jgi:hypothetical protein
MKPFAIASGTIVFSLTLAAGAATAQAQTVSRQITSEPVETIVSQGPNGTAVTRRILTPTPGVTTVAPSYVYDQAPLPDEALAPGYVESTQTLIRRPAPASRPSTVGVASTHTTATVRPSRPAATRTVTRTVVRTVVAPAVPSYAPLALTLPERQLFYRTIVQRDYVPAPAPYYGPPVVAQTEVVAPADYPLRTVYPTDYGYADYGYRPYGYGASDYGYRPYGYASSDYGYRERYAYRWDGVPLVVGARIPASVPLVAVPDWLALRIPAARPYSYAVLDNHVYLIDPATSIIVAEITP